MARAKRSPPRESKARTTTRGEETRAKIVAAALARFRRRGFDATTMREIAEAAEVAVGAAYYYFPSKEAIILAYYDEAQERSAALARATFEETDDVRERLGAIMHGRLDVIRKDRRLLTALFRTIADPASETSLFSKETEEVRMQSIALFEEALATSPEYAALDADAKRVLVLALWSLQLGFILYFMHDASAKQEKTRALVDGVLDVVVGVLPFAPSLGPLLGHELGGLLRRTGLLA